MTYYELQPNLIFHYLREIGFIKNVNESDLIITDKSDGINSVYLIEDTYRKFLPFIIKQALPTFKKHHDEAISQDRIKTEYEAYNLYQNFNNKYLPKILWFDERMYILVLEYIPKTHLLNEMITFEYKMPKIAEDIAIFLSKNFFFTSLFYLTSNEQRRLVAHFNANCVMCYRTEKYVFGERIKFYNQMASFGYNKSPLFNDKRFEELELQKKVLELKHKFMSTPQAVIHGDFKGGAILYTNKDEMFVIDYEFAFVGPMGYDLGSILYVFVASIISYTLYSKKEAYIVWLMDALEELYVKFEENFLSLWNTYKNEAFSLEKFDQEGFKRFQNDFLKSVIQDSIGFAGVRISSMMIPFIATKDTTQIEYERKESIYYETMHEIAKVFLNNYKIFEHIDDILKVVNSYIRLSKTS